MKTSCLLLLLPHLWLQKPHLCHSAILLSSFAAAAAASAVAVAAAVLLRQAITTVHILFTGCNGAKPERSISKLKR